jgi:HAD superfamily hydrolase (TIGR01509 family)
VLGDDRTKLPGGEADTVTPATDPCAILFDMDGVLVDSERPSLALLQTMLLEHGVDVPLHDLRSVFGRPPAYLNGFLGPRLAVVGVDAVDFAAEFDAHKDRLHHGGHILPFPGARDLLEGLARGGWRLALATTTQRPKMVARLAGTGILELLDATVTGDEVVHGKPAPDIFLLAAKRVGVAPDRCWVVEDSLAGVEAGKAAGMRVVAVAGTFEAAALTAADHVVHDLGELGAWLRRERAER